MTTINNELVNNIVTSAMDNGETLDDMRQLVNDAGWELSRDGEHTDAEAGEIVTAALDELTKRVKNDAYETEAKETVKYWLEVSGIDDPTSVTDKEYEELKQAIDMDGWSRSRSNAEDFTLDGEPIGATDEEVSLLLDYCFKELDRVTNRFK